MFSVVIAPATADKVGGTVNSNKVVPSYPNFSARSIAVGISSSFFGRTIEYTRTIHPPLGVFL
jgi:hypothetical protein